MPIFTLVSATSNRLKYVVESDGFAGTETRPKVQLVADCVAGPLKRLLSQTYTDGEWAALPTTGRIMIVVSMSDDSNKAVYANFSGSMAADGGLLAGYGTSGKATVEVSFRHSLTR